MASQVYFWWSSVSIYDSHDAHLNSINIILCPYLQQDATHTAYQELGHTCAKRLQRLMASQVYLWWSFVSIYDSHDAHLNSINVILCQYLQQDATHAACQELGHKWAKSVTVTCPTIGLPGVFVMAMALYEHLRLTWCSPKFHQPNSLSIFTAGRNSCGTRIRT